MQNIDLATVFDVSQIGQEIIISFKKPLKKFIVYDPGLYHTSICKSSISKIDPEDGKLYYRGTDVMNKINNDFVSVAFDIIFGNKPELNKNDFCSYVREYFVLSPELQNTLDHLPITMHPMDFLAAGITACGELEKKLNIADDILKRCAFIIAQVSVIVSYYYCRYHKKSWSVQNSQDSFANKILKCMHPEKDNITIDKLSKILNMVLILHAEHGQNCSAATVRNIASSQSSIYNAVVCGMFAFKGKLHGGASQYVSEMYQELLSSGIDVDKYVDDKISKKEPVMGFGQRTYNKILNCWDPRVETMFAVLNSQEFDFPEIAEYKALAIKLINRITKDEYFIKRNITPNPDLFNCIFYKLFGAHFEMNPVMIALGRISGWLANYIEHSEDKIQLTRPCDLYK